MTAPVFVARADGRWSLTPLASDQPEMVELASVLALVDASTVPGPPPVAPLVDLPDDGAVAPVRTVVGEVTADGLGLEDRDGRIHCLTPEHLALLDRVAGPTSVADLLAAAAADRASVVPGLAALVAAGALRVVPVPRGADATEPHPPAPSLDDAPRRRRGTPPRGPWRAATRRWRAGRDRGTQEAAEPVADEPPELAPSERAVGGPHPGGPPGRVPVYAMWHVEIGPLLSLGMLTAAARAHDGGALNEVYEIRRPETAESFLADLAGRTGPAILLSSDYLWSIDQNLALARQARAVNPELVVVHGGPSCPKYEADAARFLDQHADVAHVLARGEGEHLLAELLAALAPRLPTIDGEALRGVEGITFRDPSSGTIVRTPDRGRIAELDLLPSPYLTGEFDHIPASAWHYCMSIESNRGCPYGCSFCDWGSATLSRIRKFSLDRVTAELEWAAVRDVTTINIPDANFGIMSRDVELAERLAEIKRRTGCPEAIVYYPAKNTTKHLLRIMEIFSDASISSIAALALQSTDATTLDALERSNISVDHYVALAAGHRRRGHLVQGDLLLGSPGQTYASYRSDLQFMFDHEILERTWPVQVLPNAPMNDPEYRERHGIVRDDHDLVISTTTFSEADRDRMFRLRKVDITFEQFGLLRHVLRVLQWDHGLPATEVMDHVLDVVEATPERFPHLTWVVHYYDVRPAPPGGWTPFYDDVRRMVAEDLGVASSTALDCAFAINQFLMPVPGRTFPASIELAHDYVAHYRDVSSSLFDSGHPGRPSCRLEERPPATFTIESDPLGLCTIGVAFGGDSRDLIMQGDFYLATATANEFESSLMRFLPHLLRALTPEQIRRHLATIVPEGPQAVEERRPPDGLASFDEDEPGSVAMVTLGAGPRAPTS